LLNGEEAAQQLSRLSDAELLQLAAKIARGTSALQSAAAAARIGPVGYLPGMQLFGSSSGMMLPIPEPQLHMMSLQQLPGEFSGLVKAEEGDPPAAAAAAAAAAEAVPSPPRRMLEHVSGSVSGQLPSLPPTQQQQQQCKKPAKNEDTAAAAAAAINALTSSAAAAAAVTTADAAAAVDRAGWSAAAPSSFVWRQSSSEQLATSGADDCLLPNLAELLEDQLACDMQR
jgi:hypothetical protein